MSRDLCVVFRSFPLDDSSYVGDVEPIRKEAIMRYGELEWRLVVLTAEFHRHLGVYATIGAKMGLRAVEILGCRHHAPRVYSYVGLKPPLSCMNDGLMTSTGATPGHGLFSVSEVEEVRCAARFIYEEQAIELSLKRSYSEELKEDIERGRTLYGNSSEYWLYVRRLALKYWLDWDRADIFDVAEVTI